MSLCGGTPKPFSFVLSSGGGCSFPQFQVSCPISGGNSGGPLVNDQGQVVGIASWTKKDAQNLSFATPASFLAGLNCSLPSVPWKTPAAFTPAEPLARIQDASAAPARTIEPERSVSELKRLLKKSVGREITIVVIDHGREKKFTIVVPEDLIK